MNSRRSRWETSPGRLTPRSSRNSTSRAMSRVYASSVRGDRPRSRRRWSRNVSRWNTSRPVLAAPDPPADDDDGDRRPDPCEPPAHPVEPRHQRVPVSTGGGTHVDDDPIPDPGRERHGDDHPAGPHVADPGEDRHHGPDPRNEAAEEDGRGPPALIEDADLIELSGAKEPVARRRAEELSAVPVREAVDQEPRCHVGDPREHEDEAGLRPARLGQEGSEENEGVGRDRRYEVLHRRAGPDDDVQQYRWQRAQPFQCSFDGAPPLVSLTSEKHGHGESGNPLAAANPPHAFVR